MYRRPNAPNCGHKKTGKRYKTVPAINEIIDGKISMAAVRDVSYADLLGREEVKLDMN